MIILWRTPAHRADKRSLLRGPAKAAQGTGAGVPVPFHQSMPPSASKAQISGVSLAIAMVVTPLSPVTVVGVDGSGDPQQATVPSERDHLLANSWSSPLVGAPIERILARSRDLGNIWATATAPPGSYDDVEASRLSSFR
jgi:hypothetical protein